MLSHFIRFVRTPKSAAAVLCGLAVLVVIVAQVTSRETVYRKGEGQGKASIAADRTTNGATNGAMQNKAVLKNFVTHASPQDLPDMALQMADGREVNFSDFTGDYLLVNFWATWCAPCRKEMPQLDALAQRYQASGFRVLTLSVDRGGSAKPEKFLNDLGVRHVLRAYDPSYKSARAAKLIGLPTTLLVAPDGREIGRLAGEADWNSAAVHQLLDGYLK